MAARPGLTLSGAAHRIAPHQADQRAPDLLERLVVEPVRGQHRPHGAVRRRARGGGLDEHEQRLRDAVQVEDEQLVALEQQDPAQERPVGPTRLHVAAERDATDTVQPGPVEQPVAVVPGVEPEDRQRAPLLVRVDGEREPQLLHAGHPDRVGVVVDAVVPVDVVAAARD